MTLNTSYNVGSVLWRLFSTLEVVQYIGGITSVLSGVASVLWRLFSTVGDSFRTVGDRFSTVEVVQYSGGTSVHAGGHQYMRGITSVLWRVFSTMEGYLQYCRGGGITAVHVGDSFSTVGDTFSTEEVQCSVQWGDNISTVGG